MASVILRKEGVEGGGGAPIRFSYSPTNFSISCQIHWVLTASMFIIAHDIPRGAFKVGAASGHIYLSSFL